MYLAGYGLECLFKAELLSRNPWLKTTFGKKQLSGRQLRIYALFWESHALNKMFDEFGDWRDQMAAHDQARGTRLLLALKRIFGTWEPSLRYSTKGPGTQLAAEFVAQVGEVREWIAHLST